MHFNQSSTDNQCGIDLESCLLSSKSPQLSNKCSSDIVYFTRISVALIGRKSPRQLTFIYKPGLQSGRFIICMAG